MSRRTHLLFVFFLLSIFFCSAQFYYGSRQEFGKNRIQRQPFAWTYFPFDRYDIYLHEGGQDIARYVAVSMQKQLEQMEKRLDFQVEEKIQVLVYNNYHDFLQSNLGLATDEQGNVGGLTKITGTKVSLYFDGDHSKLDRQLKEGLAEMLINYLLYGGSAKDMVKNSTLLSVPDWFKKGLIAYFAENWNTALDSRTLDAVANDKFMTFNYLEGEEATLAGHALWNYVAETYGESVIPNIIYMTKVSRSVDNGFVFVLATSVNQLIAEWLSSYIKNENYEDTLRTLPQTKNLIKHRNKRMDFLRPQISPDGNSIAYISAEQNQTKGWILDVTTGKRRRIFRSGPKLDRVPDYSYPLLAWHPSGKYCGIITEKKNQMVLITYDLQEREKSERNITGFEKITDFSYAAEGKKLVFSGVEKGKGQSDVFVFTISSGGIEKLTNDIYDDFSPRFINGGRQIAFASNRVSDSLRKEDDGKYNYDQPLNTDIFLMDYPVQKRVLYRVTQTPDIQEIMPFDAGGGYIYYVSNANGINNIFRAHLDSVIAFVDTTEHYRYEFHPVAMTNFKRNADYISISNNHCYYASVFHLNGKAKVFRTEINPKDTSTVLLSPTYYRAQQNKLKLNFHSGGETKKSLFDSLPKLHSEVKLPHQKLSYSPKNFPLSIQQNYYVNFSMDYVVSQLDNSFLSVQYQRFAGGDNPVYMNPGLNALFKVGISDLFEDYRMVGGVRFSNNLENEFLLSWENRKKLIDKQIIAHRQAFLNYSGGLMKVHIHDIQYKIKIPFSEVLGLQLSALARNDKLTFLAIDDANLTKPNAYENLAGLKAELVLDNSVSKGLNLFHGFRGKLFAEYYRFVTKNRRDLITFGFDFRDYRKLFREIIWANRLAGGGSLGTDRLIYYLGGIDSWFRPRFDNTINIVQPQQYSFQTIATNLRGFRQNIRNGNNFIAFNSEIRIPLFRTITRHPIKNEFFQHFQCIVFGDVGSAWYGWNPYSTENTLNVNVYGSPGNPVQVTLFKQKEPIVGGFGLGVRSRIFGYFVRLDYAWGVDDHTIKKGMPMLSFCTDF
jgi:hypothetical protein